MKLPNTILKKVEKLEDSNLYLKLREILKIGNIAVLEAKKDNSKYGIPDIISKNGEIYYLLENGKMTKEVPEIMK